MEKQQRIFEEYPIKSAVLRQVFPAVAAQIVSLFYNLADTYFVGLLNDPVQTAGVTIATPPFLMLTALSNLFGIGGASAMSRALGAREDRLCRVISSTAFWYSAAVSLICMLMFGTCGHWILGICGATSETLEATWGYARWAVLYGGPVTILNILLSNLCRAEGEAGKAFVGLSLCGILNAILDPFFTLPRFLGMGAAGAGMATALSNGVALLFFLAIIAANRKKTAISLAFGYLKDSFSVIGRILAIGFPAAIQVALTVFAIAFQAKFVSNYSSEAVAALGIAKKLDHLPLYVSLGIANGMMPLLAYNDSAGNIQRCRSAFRFGTLLAVSFATLSLVVLEIFAPQLSALFIKNEKTVAYAAAFTRLLVLAMPLMAINYPVIILFQAMEKAREALVCSILRKGVLDIPLLYILDLLWPLYGCMLVQPIVDSIALFVATVYYRKVMRGRSKQLSMVPDCES